ncbi:MAG: transposase [Pseudobdellovibrionaceae bacterium]
MKNSGCSNKTEIFFGDPLRQYSTGGKTSLRGITKNGQSDIRRLLVMGTRAVMVKSEVRKDKVSQWITEKKNAKGFLKANIALANKTARIIYAVLKKQEPYRI